MESKPKATPDEFDDFLEIDRLRLKIVQRYRETLTRNASNFATQFYNYLSRFSATAATLKRFQQEGGDIAALTQKQAAHMLAMINNLLLVVPETLMYSSKRVALVGNNPNWVFSAAKP